MGSHYKGSKEEVRALNALIALMRSSQSVNSRVTGHLKDAGLTERQFAVLEALFHLGPLRQVEIAEKMLCTPGNITGLIDTLEREGLADRETESIDRRCTRVSLTDKGRALVKRVFPKHVSHVVEAFEVLTAREQEDLRSILKKLGRAAAGMED